MKIFRDTLKVRGKWSKTNLTMLVALIISIHMTYFEMYRNGFNFQVFLVWIGLATGMKYFDTIRKPVESSVVDADTDPDNTNK